MPVYEYKCKKCMKTFEIYKSIKRKDDKENCPVCGSPDTERILSLFLSNVNSCSSLLNSGV